MRQSLRSGLVRYAVAIIVLIITAVLTLALEPYLDRTPTFFYLAAVVFASWYGGLGPGVLVTILSGLILAYFFAEPRYTWTVNSFEVLRLGIYGLIGVVVSTLQGSRLRAKEQIAESRDQLRLMLEGIADGVTVQAPDGSLIFANQAAAEIVGYESPAELMQAPVGEVMKRFEVRDESGVLIPPTDLPNRIALAQGIPSPSQVVNFRVLPTGEQHWSVLKSNPVLDEQGRVRFAVNIFRDITGIMLTEQALRAERERLQVTLASIGDAVISTDAQGVVNFMNQIAQDLTGWPLVDALGRPIEDVFHIINEDTREPVENPSRRVLRDGVIVGLANHTVLLARDGREIMIDDSGAPIRDTTGQIIGSILVFRDIRERHAAERERARLAAEAEFQRERLRVTLNSIGDAVIATDIQGYVSFMNPVAEQLTGWSEDEARGLPLGQIFHLLIESTRQPPPDPLHEVLYQGKVVELHNHTLLVRRDGREITIDDSGAPIRDAQGGVIGAIFVFRDVTERKQAAEAIRQSERQLKLITDNLPALIAYVDKDHVYRFNNGVYETWFGRSREQITGRHAREVLGEEAYQRVLPFIEQTLSGREAHYEQTLTLRDAGTRDAQAIYVPDFADDGSVRGFFAMVTDISERKQQERAIREGEARFRAMFEQSAAGMVIAGPDGHWIDLNEKFAAMLGYSREELLALPGFRAVTHPDDLPGDEQEVQRLLDGHGASYRHEKRYLHKDGRTVWAIVHITLVRDQNGEPDYFVGVIEDISQRKRMELALRESEERFRTMANSTPVMIWVADSDGEITFVNDQMLDFTGLPAQQVIGPGWQELIHPEDRPAVQNEWASALPQHRPLSLEYRLRRADGEYRWVLDTGSPRFAPDGSFQGYVGGVVDITERRRSEEVQRFLGEASALLASSPDYETILASVAKIAVPHLADWCAIDMLSADRRRLERLAVEHVDPAKAALAWTIWRLQPPDLSKPEGALSVLATGQPFVLPEIPPQMIDAIEHPELREAARGLGLVSAVTVPIPLRDQPVGMITLVSGESGRRFDPEDVEIAQELARRAGSAIERARLYREAQEQRENLRVTLASIGDAVIATDRSARITFMNPVAQSLTGWDEASALGQPVESVFRIVNETSRQPAENPVERVLREGSVAGLANHTLLLARDGREIAIDDSGAPIRAESGEMTGVILVFRDITERRRAEETQRFLAEASTLLASSLDYETTLASVAALAVPRFADWCAIDVVDHGELRRMAVVHSDPGKVQLANDLREKYPPDPKSQSGVSAVIRTGRSQVMFDIPDSVFEAVQPDELREIARGLGLKSSIVVPLTMRGYTFGAITLVFAESGRRFRETDVTAAEELARRAAIAVDNARLYRDMGDQREHLRVTLSSIGDAVIATDTKARITFMNPVAQKLTGWDEEQALGLPVERVFQIIDETTRAPAESPVERVLETGSVVGLSNHTVLIAQDGREVPIDDSGAPILTEDGSITGVILVFRDITERRRTEQELQTRARQQAAVAELGQRALSDIDLPALMDEATRLVSETLGSNYTKVLELIPGKRGEAAELLLRAGCGWKKGLVGKAKVSGGLESQAGYTLFIGGPVIVDDLRTEARFSGPPLLHRHHVVSGMSTIIPGRAGVYGVLGTHTTRRRSFSQDDVNFLVSVANVLAEAIEQDRARREIEERARQQAAVAGLGQRALGDIELQELMDEATRLVSETLKLDYCKVLELLDGDAEMLLRAGHGWRKGLVGRRKVGALRGSHGGFTLLSSQPVIMEDLAAETRFEESLLVEHKVVSGVSAIIHGKQRPFGVLGAHSRQRRRFTEDDVNFLQAVANMLAEAVERNRTRDLLRESLDRTRDLYETSRRIGLLHTPHEILETLAASRLLGAPHRATVFLFDSPWGDQPPEYGELIAWHRTASAPDLTGQQFRLEDYEITQVVSRDEPVIVANPAEDRRMSGPARDILRQMGTQSMVIFPLLAGGQWYGILSLQWDTRYEVSMEDARHMQGLVDQAAAAIYNFRLLQGEAEARQRAERADALKMKFLAMISHELRTPLTSIKGFASTLLAEDVAWDSGSQHEFLVIINQEANKLGNLIEQLLDLSRLEAGTLSIKKQREPLNEFLASALPPLYVLTPEHRLEINAPEVMPALYIDSVRIAQVLSNIVNNAANYSPAGSTIRIDIGCDDHTFRIDVSDEGPGIAREERDIVFEAFRQAANRPKREVKGAGLGLAISRALVEAHGGRIWIEDRPGPGTTISFTLPLGMEEAEAPQEEESAAD